MDVFSAIVFVGGLALLIHGMHGMSTALEALAGDRLRSALGKMTATTFRGAVFGTAVTAAIQSSSALTVMLVGLVNAGVMELRQTVGVILGANIGTTLTPWILSFAGVGGDAPLLRLLAPETIAPVAAFVGMLLSMLAKKPKKKEFGAALVGFALLLLGMRIMGDAVSPLARLPGFARMLTAFHNPLLGVLAGTAFTALIQCSAASVGVLQALSLAGGVTYGMAIPVVMGQNIGTCFTALLSGIGTSRNARRVGMIHILYNIIGSVAFLLGFYLFDRLAGAAFGKRPVGPAGIALIHSVFNVASAIVFLPFSGQLEALSKKIIPNAAGKGRVRGAPRRKAAEKTTQ